MFLRIFFSSSPPSKLRLSCHLQMNFSTQTEQYPLGLAACISSLQFCAQHNNLRVGKQLHAHTLRTGHFYCSPLSTTSLINMYAKCYSIHDALLVFTTSPTQNTFTYNAIISGFISNDSPKQAYEYYIKMRTADILPDKFTFPCVIKACFGVSDVKKIHGFVYKIGLELDLFIGSALLHSFLKFGLVDDGLKVFSELPNRDDVVLWNAMINGCTQIGEVDKAMEIFGKMDEEGILPNKFSVTGILSGLAMVGDIYNGKIIHGFVMKKGFDSGVAVCNALIDMYGKCKCINEALQVFYEMQDEEKDVFSWNSILCVYERIGYHEETLRLFDRMLRARGVWPDLVTITTVLPACAHLAALLPGRKIHAYMIVNGLGENAEERLYDDTHIGNAVMDMYAKCGSMREAHIIFERVKYKDVASWNIMIKGYGVHGFGNLALDMFWHMCDAGFTPDDVTFVGVLSACSHTGLLDQGRELLAQMQPRYGIVPSIEHYTCVIDMLGRAGQLDEGFRLLSTMPVEGNPVVWRAFLAACRLHGNADLAATAMERVIELEPEHCGNYVLMSNIYGEVGKFDEVSEVRHTMRKQNVKKTPGCSWIELSNGVHIFITGDRSHPEEHLIYAGLNSLMARMCENEDKADGLEVNIYS